MHRLVADQGVFASIPAQGIYVNIKRNGEGTVEPGTEADAPADPCDCVETGRRAAAVDDHLPAVAGATARDELAAHLVRVLLLDGPVAVVVEAVGAGAPARRPERPCRPGRWVRSRRPGVSCAPGRLCHQR